MKEFHRAKTIIKSLGAITYKKILVPELNPELLEEVKQPIIPDSLL